MQNTPENSTRIFKLINGVVSPTFADKPVAFIWGKKV
jgi:hypothetical protein